MLARRGLTGADAEALLFVSSGGRPLRYSNWRRRVWLPAIEAAALDDLPRKKMRLSRTPTKQDPSKVRFAELPALDFHDLRSNNATALVAAGVDVKTAQVRLGHSSPHVTLALYARVTAEKDREAANKLGVKFRPLPSRGEKPGASGGD
ncbi:MAG: site-specific recombinase XerD [Acidimicrobiaceae bacterium]|nr:site-specific recombinase XerD [Acidimicrobiaceae bacterium]